MVSKILNDFLNGQSYEAYKYFGAHFITINKKKGVIFRVYAPMAKEVSVIGDFNSWDPKIHLMYKVDISGVFEIFIEGVKNYDFYKYHIKCADGVYRDKQDPFANFSDLRPLTRSRIFDVENFIWHDEAFLKKRNRNFDRPVSIYEMHLGSWLGIKDGRIRSYEEIADDLIPYILNHGYTHVEIMPITQYPFDGSWGYQVTGFYAVDSRYGNPYQLMSLIDRLHKNNIGVILDYVVVHFATDSYALEKFDGTCVYEYSNENEFSQWGSKLFDLGKDPVRSFLISGVNYFLDYFHFDGVRFDAISNVIYWNGDSTRGINHGAIEFIKRLTGKLHIAHNDVMLIAEDSSSYPGVTHSLESGGLGFDYKWDLGWMNDTLKYYAKDPLYRKFHHNDLTFSMAYFFSENFLLPLSHDEVVHGKGTIINKIYGEYEMKFAQVRNLYTYQYSHPGKKLNFMGNELASFDEWNETKSLPWELKKFPKHDSISRMIRDLNLIYCHEKAMHFEEYNPAHFQWLIVDNSDQSIYAFQRIFEDENKKEILVFVFNMTPNYYENYDIGVIYEGEYLEIFNSDKDVYGGFNQYNGLPLKTETGYCFNKKYKITIKLASFGALILKCIIDKKEKGKKEAKLSNNKETKK